MVQIEWCWFHFRIFIFGQVMAKMAHMLIFRHTFFGHNSATFCQIGLKIFMGTQETIIYRLAVRSPSYDVFEIFWGEAATLASTVSV